MKRYLLVLKFVLIVAALNSVVSHLLSSFVPETINTVLFNLVRVSLFIWAGWLVVATRLGGLWGAALGGALVLVIDHPVVTGGFFLVSGEFSAFLGVLISFVMFVWVAMLLGLAGGLASRWRLSRVVS
jgi:hypothetical protein